MRHFIDLIESSQYNLDPFITLAQKHADVETFISKTDGMDVLYRGHHGEKVGNNAFMTDYVGHAREYAGDEGKVDAFACDWSDVLTFNDARFNDLRRAVGGLSDHQLAAIYRDAIAERRLANAMMNGGTKTAKGVLTKVKKIINSDVPYSSISTDATINDLLVPLMQAYALEQGKNIIGFVGGDYYGDQNEFVVSDISKLANLRDLHRNVQSDLVDKKQSLSHTGSDTGTQTMPAVHEAHVVTTMQPDRGGYDEQTVHLPYGGGLTEIVGCDGYGWYGYKKDIAQFNQETREYRRSERISPSEWGEHAPLPFKTKPSKNRLFVYLFQPDGSPMVRDWLTMNGAIVGSEDE